MEEQVGVSRSGRIRRKSSKLTDFESTEDSSIKSYDLETESMTQNEQEVQDGKENIDDFDEISEEDFALIPNTSLETEFNSDTQNGNETNTNQTITLLYKEKNVKFSGYMLWAKNASIRLYESNPSISYSGLSKLLRTYWASLSHSEKCLWTQKAITFAPQQKYNSVKSTTGSKSLDTDTQKSFSNSSSLLNSGLYKVVGTEPIDTAAHLKLLGESLSIIGKRLTEHQGQIAVSGSLSVLLDSLLCAMGPILCLTTQVPELNVIQQENLSKILDNVAYIMPGL